MSRIVLDASVVLSWMLPTQATRLAEALLDRAARLAFAVPNCFDYEVRNVLLQAERRGSVSEDQTEAFLLQLWSYDIHVAPVPSAATIEGAMELGRAHRVSLFDGLYIDLAIRDGLRIASRDHKLLDGAVARGVEIVTEASLP